MPKLLSEKFALNRSDDRIWLLVTLAAASLVMLPMPLMGVPEGYDILDHLLFAQAYKDALLNGSLTVSWVGASHYGLGSVGTRFYPPLADFVTGLTGIFTNDWYNSFLITAFFWMIPGCIGVYLWAREFVDPRRSAVAGILYALMPYHLFQIYQFTLFSEFAAASILPFCFLYITRIVNRGAAIDVILFSVAFSLLILTHLPTTITGSIAIATYTLFVVDRTRFWPVLRDLVIAGAVALAATSFFWIKLVTELDWVAHNSNTGVSGSKAFSFHLYPIFLAAPETFYRLKMMWLVDSSTTLTLMMLVPVVIVAFFRFRLHGLDAGQQKLIAALTATGLVTMFLLSLPSKLVWEYAPVLGKIQFPWRFLSPASVVASVSFAIAVPIIIGAFPRLKRVTIYGVVVVLFGVVVFDAVENIISSAPYSRALFQKEYGDLTEKKSCNCWLPAWAKESALMRPERVDAGGRSVEIQQWKPLSRTFTIAEGQADAARIGTFWYPYWRATVNGSVIDPGRNDEGTISIPLPDGRAEIRLYFEEPRIVESAKYFSLAVWLALAAALFVAVGRQRRARLRSLP